MKFKVDRASYPMYSPASPCDDAIKEGKNWFVNISTIKSLLQFIKKNGEIIINEQKITIYDDYVE